MSSTTTPTVHVEPITDASPHKINCPCCGKPRLIVTEAGMKNAGGMYLVPSPRGTSGARRRARTMSPPPHLTGWWRGSLNITTSKGFS